jgi:hypothetical protein
LSTTLKHAVDDEDVLRYSGVSVMVVDGVITISGELGIKELGIVCRFLAIQPPTGNITGGYLRTPEMVKLYGMSKNKDSRILHVMHGDNFVRVRRTAA